MAKPASMTDSGAKRTLAGVGVLLRLGVQRTFYVRCVEGQCCFQPSAQRYLQSTERPRMMTRACNPRSHCDRDDENGADARAAKHVAIRSGWVCRPERATHRAALMPHL